MKRSLKLSLVTAFAALALGAGSAAADHDYYSDGPPPVRYERVAPRAGYVWVQGHYDFDYANNQWVWNPGHYERARAGYAWTDGRWDNNNGTWIWIDGRWNPEYRYDQYQEPAYDHDPDHHHDSYDRDYDRGYDRGRDHRRVIRFGWRRHHRHGGRR
jgi:hypothetical protein